jgi:hypothetical protein
VRGLYLVDAIGINQVRGLPFRVDDLVAAITSVIDGTVTRTAVGSAGRNGGPMTVPSIQVGDDGDEDAVAASERAGTPPAAGESAAGESADGGPPDGRTMATSVNGGSR